MPLAPLPEPAGTRGVRRLSVYILPVVAFFATIFGLFYGWIGVETLFRGETGAGLFLLIFGFGGIALGTALFTTWRKLMRAAEGSPDV